MRAAIHKNDTVMVIAGRERGKTGKVVRVIPEKSRAIVERLNMVKRHTKARGPQSPYGIVEKEAPLHLSNLMIMCDKCNAPVRMGKLRLEDGRSVRICRRCKEQLDR
ncbi:MAG TPA: 50S ribosomal protein L24 [Candidatus Margulisiibacteriota bacterium]|nr:50S ribosomal protein L24 [Candidatus Margulisiibacteriota bacterium]